MKKLISLVLALAMILMVGASFAGEVQPDQNQTVNVDPNYSPAEKQEAGEFTNPTGAFSGTPETTISASGLISGDTVEVYQLVEWDSVNSDWKLKEANCGVTVDQLVNGITEAEATTIAKNVAKYTLVTTLTVENGAVSYDCSNHPGLYYLKAIPAATNKNTVYNPAFVSADYYAGGNVVDFGNATIGASTVFKKSQVPFEKEVDDADKTKFQDVKPGDTIPFVVTSTIPSYGTTFTNPVFKIEDTLSTGLKLSAEPQVFIDDVELTGDAKAAAYIYTPKTNGAGYTIEFKDTYLTGLKGTQPNVKVTYSADVTTEALNNVTYMDNEAKLTFSNTPTTTSDKDDITRHYTFSIDGNLFGTSGTQTHELIKVACKADGTPIYEETTTYYDDGVNPLDGASFTLTPTGTTTLKNGETSLTATSSDGGHVQFLGLDAGTYELVEASAPAGYTRDTRTYEIMIDPTYDDKDSDAPILLKYEIKFRVKGAAEWGTISSFTAATNDGGTKVVSSAPAADGQYIGNTPGNELPSTGGIGTTIFYILGGLLVIGAAVILVARRKAHD